MTARSSRQRESEVGTASNADHHCSATKVTALSVRVFGVLSFWTCRARNNNLFLPIFGRDNIFLRARLCGGVWIGFLWEKAPGKIVKCQFCGADNGDGHFFFWEMALFTLLFMSVISLCFCLC